MTNRRKVRKGSRQISSVTSEERVALAVECLVFGGKHWPSDWTTGSFLREIARGPIAGPLPEVKVASVITIHN